MLIDGKLTEAGTGATFDNINPATEAVLGPTADATHDDMEHAIGAARRAFDETDWSTDHELRRTQCLLQLRDALDAEHERIRAGASIAEVGCPLLITLTGTTQLDVRRSPSTACGGRPRRRHSSSSARSATGADRHGHRHARAGATCGRTSPSASSPPSSAWNYPARPRHRRQRPAVAGRREHRGASSRRRLTPWSAARSSAASTAQQTDIPAGVVQRRAVVGSAGGVPATLAADPRVDHHHRSSGSTATGPDTSSPQRAPTDEAASASSSGGKSAHDRPRTSARICASQPSRCAALGVRVARRPGLRA